MELTTVTARSDRAVMSAHHALLSVTTAGHLQFLNLTDLIRDHVRQSGVQNGFVNIQTRHTTAAILVNENEPLLLDDMKATLEKVAPRDGTYQHDNLALRTMPVPADEPRNGDAHCKSLLLRTSETLNITRGVIQLGEWQRVFLVELDSSRRRTVSIMVLGL